MPLISSNWSKIAKWYGHNPVAAEALNRLTEVVAKTQQQGKRIRFWATGDNPVVWQVLLDAGVDLINTDDLAGLSAFLKKRTVR